MILAPRRIEIRVAHFFAGIGGGAKGFNAAQARVGHLEAEFRCIGGIDVDAGAVRSFERLTGARGTVLDLMDREQFFAFHGKEPPPGWREASVDDVRQAFGGERPHIVFTSPPCKGFSGLLSEERSATGRYQALNRLTLRGVWLALEAWADDPPEFFLLENVPRISNRGRPLLDQIEALLTAYGYAVAETTHDCGELGGLAQSRRRFLLVARHREKVPPFLYQPPRRSLRAVGEILGALPLPGDPAAGPMHRMRVLQWKTWVRLAFVAAGGDWRSLEQLRVVDGHLADFGILPEGTYRGVLGVNRWSDPAATITGAAAPTRGAFSVADPRPENWDWAEGRRGLGVVPWDGNVGAITSQARSGQGGFAVADPRFADGMGEYGQLGVKRWDEPANAVTGQSLPGGGRHSVADPRCAWHPAAFRNKLRIIPWDAPAGTVIGAAGPDSGGGAVADPRLGPGPRGPHFNNVYRVIRFDEPAPTVTAGTSPSAGGLAVADPRAGSDWRGRGKYLVTPFDAPVGTVIAASTTGNGAFAVADPRTGPLTRPGPYGVVPWAAASGAVTGHAGHDNGRFSVADPRLVDEGSEQPNPTGDATCQLPAPDARLVAVIRALDGTWHRPFTTLELAALQSLFEPGETLELDGASDSRWREWIGNAVPPAAATAIGSVMAQTLLLAWSGETFILSSSPIWVEPEHALMAALAVDIPAGLM